jgi:L-fucose mutarotase
MLKGVPPVLSPELMLVLMRMGHGDEIVFADGNFPADGHAERIVRADGHGVPRLLEAVLRFLPLDTFVAAPAAVMQPVDASEPEPAIWTEYRRLIDAAEGRRVELEQVERFAFYERARAAYAIVATGEAALYANLILKKGVVRSC